MRRDLLHLFGVAFGELTRPDISELPPIMAAWVPKFTLMPTVGEHPPVMLAAERPVGGALHEKQIGELRAGAVEDAKDELHEDRRLEYVAVDTVCEIVEVRARI